MAPGEYSLYYSTDVETGYVRDSKKTAAGAADLRFDHSIEG
jgi:hypothetical protein